MKETLGSLAKVLAAILLAGIAINISGCAGFGNERQYDEGNWYGMASSSEVARIKQDKLSFSKLRSLPAQTSSTVGILQGYEGKIINLSESASYNFILVGPETKSYFKGPKEQVKDYLIPGTYTCYVRDENNRQVGSPWTFHVTPQLHDFKGEKIHWYVYMK